MFRGKGLLGKVSMEGPRLCFKVKASSIQYQWEDLDCVSSWRSHRWSINGSISNVFWSEDPSTEYWWENLGCVPRWSPYRWSIDERTLAMFQGKGLIGRVSMAPQLCFNVKTSSIKYRWEDLGCVSRWSPHRQSIDGRTSIMFRGEDLIDKISMGEPLVFFEVKSSSTEFRWEDLGCVSGWRPYGQSIDRRTSTTFRGEDHIYKVSMWGP